MHKFRAWDTVDKHMYYNHSVCMSIDGFISFLDNTGEWISGDDRIILQPSTTKQDIHKKDIYAGDIVIASGFIESPYIIQWHEIGWGVRSIKNDAPILVNLSAWKMMEIIGNIYENEEYYGEYIRTTIGW